MLFPRRKSLEEKPDRSPLSYAVMSSDKFDVDLSSPLPALFFSVKKNPRLIAFDSGHCCPALGSNLELWSKALEIFLVISE